MTSFGDHFHTHSIGFTFALSFTPSPVSPCLHPAAPREGGVDPQPHFADEDAEGSLGHLDGGCQQKLNTRPPGYQPQTHPTCLPLPCRSISGGTGRKTRGRCDPMCC